VDSGAESRKSGKRDEPSEEELEFIHGCLLRGLSDREVLEEMQGTELPLRSLGFMKRRRKEFRAARKVLQEKVKKEFDPVLAEYRKQHLAEVEDSIRKRKDELGVLSPQYEPFPAELDQLPTRSSEPGRLPFDKLDTHLPKSIWDKLEQRELMQSAYLELCSQLLKEIECESKRRTGLKIDRSSDQRSIPYLTPFFSKLVYMDICGRASGFSSGVLGDNPDYKVGSGANGEGQLWLSGKLIAEVSPGEIDRHRRVHADILREYRESEEAERLVKPFEELTSLTHTIEAELTQILLSRSYREGRCEFCP